MRITFEGPAVFVDDIDASRRFYESALGQEVLADHGPHVVFAGGFSLWQATYAVAIIHQGEKNAPRELGGDNFELYFESEDLDGAWRLAEAAGARAVHPVREHPWGQRGFRILDPDGHLVEVGEPLPVLVRRLLAEGMTPAEVHERTSIPLPMVRQMAG